MNLRSMLFAAPLAVLPLLVACQPQSGSTTPPPAESAPRTEAPPPSPVPQSDADKAPIERAAPPTLRAVALGRFRPHNELATAATGAIEIGEDDITGENGAKFVTERVAIVRGGDEFTAGQRYADVMKMDSEEPVELRRVVDETTPGEGGKTFCNGMKTGFLAIAAYGYAEDKHTLVKIIGLQGDGLPAAGSKDTTLCALAVYEDRK